MELIESPKSIRSASYNDLDDVKLHECIDQRMAEQGNQSLPTLLDLLPQVPFGKEDFISPQAESRKLISSMGMPAESKVNERLRRRNSSSIGGGNRRMLPQNFFESGNVSDDLSDEDDQLLFEKSSISSYKSGNMNRSGSSSTQRRQSLRRNNRDSSRNRTNNIDKIDRDHHRSIRRSSSKRREFVRQKSERTCKSERTTKSEKTNRTSDTWRSNKSHRTSRSSSHTIKPSKSEASLSSMKSSRSERSLASLNSSRSERSLSASVKSNRFYKSERSLCSASSRSSKESGMQNSMRRITSESLLDQARPIRRGQNVGNVKGLKSMQNSSMKRNNSLPKKHRQRSKSPNTRNFEYSTRSNRSMPDMKYQSSKSQLVNQPQQNHNWITRMDRSMPNIFMGDQRSVPRRPNIFIGDQKSLLRRPSGQYEGRNMPDESTTRSQVLPNHVDETSMSFRNIRRERSNRKFAEMNSLGRQNSASKLSSTELNPSNGNREIPIELRKTIRRARHASKRSMGSRGSGSLGASGHAGNSARSLSSFSRRNNIPNDDTGSLDEMIFDDEEDREVNNAYVIPANTMQAKQYSKRTLGTDSCHTNTTTTDTENGDDAYIKVFRGDDDDVSVLSFDESESSDEEVSLAPSTTPSLLNKILGSSMGIENTANISDDDDSGSVVSTASSIKSMFSTSSRSILSSAKKKSKKLGMIMSNIIPGNPKQTQHINIFGDTDHSCSDEEDNLYILH